MAEETVTPDEVARALAAAQEQIGTEAPPLAGRYPVEHDPIRRYCAAVDDLNPLFLDPEHAAGTRHGSVICPPLFVGYFACPGVWPPFSDEEDEQRGAGTFWGSGPRITTPGTRPINLTTEYELLKPVKVGDLLSVVSRFADVYIKPIRIDPNAFWRVTERTVTNQDGDVVAIVRSTGITYKEPEQDD